jgi:hypothetical protein
VQVFWATLLLRDREQSTMRAAPYWCATTSFLFITPLVAHCALVLRIVAFYPPMLAASGKRWAVAAFPTLMKVVRIPFIVLYLVAGYRSVAATGAGGFDEGLARPMETKWAVAYFALTFLDNAYTTLFLLRKFHQLGYEAGLHDNALLVRRRTWLVDQAKQTCLAIGFSHIIPTLFTLVVVICLATPAVGRTRNGFILVANVFVSVFGSTLACTNSSARWRDDRFANGTPGPRNSVPRRGSFSDIEGGLLARGRTYSIQQQSQQLTSQSMLRDTSSVSCMTALDERRQRRWRAPAGRQVRIGPAHAEAAETARASGAAPRQAPLSSRSLARQLAAYAGPGSGLGFFRAPAASGEPVAPHLPVYTHDTEKTLSAGSSSGSARSGCGSDKTPAPSSDDERLAPLSCEMTELGRPASANPPSSPLRQTPPSRRLSAWALFGSRTGQANDDAAASPRTPHPLATPIMSRSPSASPDVSEAWHSAAPDFDLEVDFRRSR